MRRTPFSVGRRWFCERAASGRPSFHFVIIGPGETPLEKLCRVEEDPASPYRIPPFEQCYSHRHLKKYAKIVEEP